MAHRRIKKPPLTLFVISVAADAVPDSEFQVLISPTFVCEIFTTHVSVTIKKGGVCEG